MGCFTLGANRISHPEIGADNHGGIVVGSVERVGMKIGASMVCSIAARRKVYLKDSLGRSLRDILGRYLLGKEQ